MESDILSKGASYSGHRFNHHCQLIWEFWLAGLLRILSTVLSIPYPSGSPSDCYYKCSCISVLYFLKPMTDSQKWPPGTFDAHSLPISITLLPSFFPTRRSLWVQCFLLLSIYLFCFIAVLLFLQATGTDFSNVGSMIECGLFIEALDSIRSAVFPGLLPPAPYLVSLLEYAQQVGPELPEYRNSHLPLHEPQALHLHCILAFFLAVIGLNCNLTCLFAMSQGNATTVFLRSFWHVMYNLLLTNPPWLAPSTVKKYFTLVLQCPRCKTGLWPFLETAIR